MPRQLAGLSSGPSSSSNFGEQARSLAALALLSLLLSFRVKHNLWSLCFRAFPGRRALGLNPVASTAVSPWSRELEGQGQSRKFENCVTRCPH